MYWKVQFFTNTNPFLDFFNMIQRILDKPLYECEEIFLAILHLQTLPYQNRVVAIFFSSIYGCHFVLKNGRYISRGSKTQFTCNQVEKHVILFVWLQGFQIRYIFLCHSGNSSTPRLVVSLEISTLCTQ